MKKTGKVFVVSLLFFVFLLSFNVMAMDKLVSIPTAEITGGKGFVRGEIIGSSSKQLEFSYSVNSSLSIGGIVNVGNHNNNDIGLLVKARIMTENENNPELSAGIRMDDFYFVSSKYVGSGFKGYVGVGNDDLGGLFLGFTKVLNPLTISKPDKPSMPVISLMGEYVNKDINLGLSMKLQDNLNMDVSLLDFEDIKVGMEYKF